MSAPLSCYGSSISLLVSLIKELKRLVKNKAFLEKNWQWLASLRILQLGRM
ncbi:hypothetical protein G3808_003003 [Escherichia coli]|nr:hypothetical protein [Escherichia coli]EGO6592507.1 hypothetical protein [Escherichia coli]EGO6598555.1 hypothetical protein [Escherichia coli]EGO6611691.1 hypothetical protein [Escherichia coli]EGO6626844.1 hypothetical protein [Escherichia coli]